MFLGQDAAESFKRGHSGLAHPSAVITEMDNIFGVDLQRLVGQHDLIHGRHEVTVNLHKLRWNAQKLKGVGSDFEPVGVGVDAQVDNRVLYELIAGGEMIGPSD